ncbi:MAG TPA: GDSL-type esterase/lipase family protein [Vicinamibacterales bacterium]|nr:GDSL-type esterase/lipase family protein [Vicinamibacterales bacterium]
MLKVGSRLALCAALLVVVACGGHHHPTSPTPPPDDQGSDNPPPPPPPPTLKVTRILCFGDSMTYGVTKPAPTFQLLDAGLPVSYPYKLQTLETARYTDQTITVMNAGQAGEDAGTGGAPGRDRLPGVLGEAAPDVLLLMEGANDLNAIPRDVVSENAAVQHIVDAMEDMVRASQYRNVPVMLATLPPQRPGGKSSPYLDQYNRGLRAMAKKKGAMLVDVNAQFPVDLIGNDSLHPTEAGYEKLAEIFQAALAAAYEVPPAAPSAARR